MIPENYFALPTAKKYVGDLIKHRLTAAVLWVIYKAKRERLSLSLPLTALLPKHRVLLINNFLVVVRVTASPRRFQKRLLYYWRLDSIHREADFYLFVAQYKGWIRCCVIIPTSQLSTPCVYMPFEERKDYHAYRNNRFPFEYKDRWDLFQRQQTC